MTYTINRLDFRGDEWAARLEDQQIGTIYQTPAWLEFVSRTQQGEPIVAAVRDGEETIGYFTGLIVQKFGLRILGSPFPGWSTAYMGFALSAEVDKRQAVRALLQFAFRELGCMHLEMMDRNLTVEDLDGLGVQYRIYRGFEIDLTRGEGELFSSFSSACRRCVRKAEREGVVIEEADDPEFAHEYYEQLGDVFAKQGLVPTYSLDRVQQLITHVQPTGHLILLRARDRQRRCVATGIFPHMNGVMYFWGGASWRHSQSLRPNELLQWQAMKIGKRMGMRTYDMGGGGEYKRKYGGKDIAVPWFGKSKYAAVRYLRDIAQQSHTMRQRFLGLVRRAHPFAHGIVV